MIPPAPVSGSSAVAAAHHRTIGIIPNGARFVQSAPDVLRGETGQGSGAVPKRSNLQKNRKNSEFSRPGAELPIAFPLRLCYTHGEQYCRIGLCASSVPWMGSCHRNEKLVLRCGVRTRCNIQMKPYISIVKGEYSHFRMAVRYCRFQRLTHIGMLFYVLTRVPKRKKGGTRA